MSVYINFKAVMSQALCCAFGLNFVSLPFDPKAPASVAAPTITTITATTVGLTWTFPSQPNGNITSFSILLHSITPSPVVMYQGLALGTLLAPLRPFTAYSVSLSVCTAAGCSSSSQVSVVTQEAGMLRQTLVITKLTHFSITHH